MIEIREVEGRYEIYSADRHWEVFGTKLRAQAAALALADDIKREAGRWPKIRSPWPVNLPGSGSEAADNSPQWVLPRA